MTDHREPLLVPVQTSDLELLLEASESLDLDAEELAAVRRLTEAATAGVQARARWRAGQQELDLAGEAGGNVLALGRPASHTGGHDTEVNAARTIALKAGSLRARVLAHLVQCGDHGATDVEIEEALGLRRPTGGSRRGELVKLGHVERARRDGAFPVTRVVPGHLAAAVWIATDQGRQALEDLGYTVDTVDVMVAGSAEPDRTLVNVTPPALPSGPGPMGPGQVNVTMSPGPSDHGNALAAAYAEAGYVAGLRRGRAGR